MSNKISSVSVPQRLLKVLLSLVLTKPLVRFVFIKFYGYYNQHKMSLLGAFLLPFFVLFLSLFIKLDNNKKREIKHKLQRLYPHVSQPVLTPSNCVRIVLQSVYLALFNTTTTSQQHITIEQRKTWRKITRSARLLRLADSKLVRSFKVLWLVAKKQTKTKSYKAVSRSSI